MAKVDTLANKLIKTSTEISRLEGEIMKATAMQQKQLVKLRENDANVREAIKEAMEANDLPRYENEDISITYVKASERVGVDLNKLRVLHPQIAEDLKKITHVKASVRIKAK